MVNIPHEIRVKRLFAQYGVRFAYLFGSRATGKGQVAASDYDFAVFFGRGTPKSRFAMRLKLRHELQELFAPFPLDLIVLDDVRSFILRDDIIRTGTLIYTKDEGRRLDFEVQVMREHDEFSPFLRAYNQMYLKHAV